MKQPDEFMHLVGVVSKRIQDLSVSRNKMKFGTLNVSPFYNNQSALLYKNCHDDCIPVENPKKISHEVFHKIYEVDRYPCTSYPIPCGHVYLVSHGPYAGAKCFKEEANSVWNFGGRLAVDDAGAILKAQEECYQPGLDIDNAFGPIAWAIDCFENALLSKKETDGLTLSSGDYGVELFKKIAYRQGLRNILAEGSSGLAKYWAKGLKNIPSI